MSVISACAKLAIIAKYWCHSSYLIRMIWQKVSWLETSQVSANLGVDNSTVWKIVKLFRETGSVQKKAQPGAVKVLTSVAELILISEGLEHPILTHLRQTDCEEIITLNCNNP